MSKKPPPVPAENRSPKGVGERKSVRLDEASKRQAPNPEKQGQQGNINVNTTHQINQQDR
ncbi:hypothetical protein NKH57_27850 [Mesorhizobium sp. M1050]|uniref:hypothetical protein n=1 Tax=unclassified Mesorhizobium TaxID=325217 RepID=UPI00040728AA|nr:hypothetical protein [Mesorhizobium sp. LNHC252B00]